jgi:hypothetical protein
MKRIFFFATPEDIVPVLRRFEANDPLKFVVLGNLTTPNRAIYLQASDIPNPGVATHETGSASTAYMVSLRDTKNHMHKFVGNSGEYRWTLDNGDNEETVVLTMAGLWEDGTLLPGLMDTLHQTPVAQQLMKWFLAALKQEGFVKIESWWVGPVAMEMLRSGKRLTTTAVQSPPQFDLKLPERTRAG